VETGEPQTIRSDVSAIRRQLATVRRFLAPQRDALDALFRQGKLFLDEDKLYLVREQSDRITRYVEDLDLVRERALVVQEELFNRISQEQNARTYVLSIVAAIFLPITFISGVFGMNVAGLPGLEDINSFWIVSGVMLATSVAILIGLRWKKWF
jgi:zinc transporter